MSLTKRLLEPARLKALMARQSDVSGPRRVLVLARTDVGRWQFVEGEAGGDRLSVLNTGLIGEDAKPEFTGLESAPEAVLVANSHKSVCRLLDIVEATPAQLRQLVALRLETELPYPVAESTWVCERQKGVEGAPGNVLVMATASGELAAAESSLRETGVECSRVEAAAAGLAELAASQGGQDDTVALLHLGESDATLVITRAGELRYARHIPAPGGAEQDTAALANELNHSIYDYLLRCDGERPARIVAAGRRMHDEGLLGALSACTGSPVEPARCSASLHVSAPISNDELLAGFAVCIGALAAVHRRIRGERAVAPSLRSRTRAFEGVTLPGRRAGLIALNCLLVLLLIAVSFGVRAARLHAANRVIEESRPLLQGLERLDDEVDILRHENLRQRSLLDTMQLLAEALPGELKLETLTIDPKGKVSISGKTGSVEAASHKAVAALTDAPAFINPRFLGAMQEKEGYSFRIECELRQGRGGAAR